MPVKRIPMPLRQGHKYREKAIIRRVPSGKWVVVKPIARERLAGRALSLGLSDERQLSQFTGLPVQKIEGIRAQLRLENRLPKSSWENRKAQAFLVEGERTIEEISKRTGLTKNTIMKIRQELKENGIETNIGSLNTPLARLARALYRRSILEQAGIRLGVLTEAAGKDIEISTLAKLLRTSPGLTDKIRAFDNGRHWKKAKSDLKNWEENIKAKGKRAITLGSGAKTRRIEELFIEGRLTSAEIATQEGVTRKFASNVLSRLSRQGIQTRIPGTIQPPMSVARATLKLEVLLQISGESIMTCAQKISASEKWASRLDRLHRDNPQIIQAAKTFGNGRFWNQAQKELAPWIKEKEQEYGQKYNPRISRIMRFAKKYQKNKTKK
jgi:menaquinone-dependent protoporphyrinogen IX oxidase